MSSYSTLRPKKRVAKLPPAPRSARMAGVRSSLDTGASKTKVDKRRVLEKKRRAREPFGRVSARQLYEVIVAYDESTGDGEGEEDDAGTRKPFVVVDVAGSIGSSARVMGSVECTQTHLARDRVPAAVVMARTGGKDVILYDEDDVGDSQAPALARTLMDRGWERVFVLTGGLVRVLSQFPILIDGTPTPAQLAAAEALSIPTPSHTSSTPRSAASPRASRSTRMAPKGAATAKGFSSFARKTATHL